ncbi:uncharacterized protein LOC126677528 [Mercurialis annua]|uniref:uncharacterized protein LOC126677528 n=1 Tax=Mercurialis annua TaxID=3986 RepID=UPI0021600A87|nr:uncharacterized protein LOC126677528 [Mercurialis annua]
MKVSGIWVLYFVVGTALMFFNFSCATASASFSISDMVLMDRGGEMIMAATNRKLKEKSYNPSVMKKKKRDAGLFNLDDYHPIDPVPSSKASIKPGPIEHGTPLNPFIPKPSPPSPAPPKKVG